MTSFVLAAYTLFTREVVRFVRQPHRIVGALGTPLVFWFLIGSGLGRSFRAPSLEGVSSAGYLHYFFPGTIVLILLFTAIFSTISIIEDRREGFLQAVLVAPIPRAAVVAGKLLGGAVLATAQAALFMALVPLLGVTPGAADLTYILVVMFFMSLGLTGLGFVFAWRLDSTQGFHAIMNLFLMPLWFLSGALFPTDGAPAWLGWVMRINPLSYGVSALHHGFFGGLEGSRWSGPSPSACLWATIAFAVVMFAVSHRVARRTA